jgi:hypothetical protein
MLMKEEGMGWVLREEEWGQQQQQMAVVVVGKQQLGATHLGWNLQPHEQRGQWQGLVLFHFAVAAVAVCLLTS